MIFCCDNCHFLFLNEVFDRQCPDCGKLHVRAANEQDRAEFKRIQIANEQDDWAEWFTPKRYQAS